MKKAILSLVVIATAFWAQSQVVVEGVSPAAIQGNYSFRPQVNSGAWPGEGADDGSWDVLSNIDFNVPGANVTDTLMLVDDGTPGTNPQGNPMAQEGCAPLINDLTGKIAVIYRNTCFFSDKILNAQNAGAVAAIIINREDALIGMSAGATGVNVQIPAVFISSVDGATLVNQMAMGPVVMFIGNKLGINANDLSSYSDDALRSPYTTTSNLLNNGFEVGVQVYNWGSNAQNVTVNAQITDPSASVVYDETVVGPLANSGDTIQFFPTTPQEFPRFDLGLGNYPNGEYTLTYTITGDNPDDAIYDNTITSNFTVTNDYISLVENDAMGNPSATSYPVGVDKPADYQACVFLSDSMAAGMAVSGLSFVAYADTTDQATTGVTLGGAEIFINAYRWDDAWPSMNDPAWFGTGASNDPYAMIESNLLDFVTYYPAGDNEIGVPANVSFNAPIMLTSTDRYLFCIQSFDTNVVFGFDGAQDYSWNVAVYGMPTAPVKGINPNTLAPQWYAGSWSSLNASSITLDVMAVGLDENSTVAGSAYPNPATDKVTIKVEANGGAVVTVTDITGKLVLTDAVTLKNNTADMNIDALEAGMYIFNVELENGLTSQFNVVKR